VLYQLSVLSGLFEVCGEQCVVGLTFLDELDPDG
jgi:hypothetical protein